LLIRKLIEFTQEVDVHINAEDISVIYADDADLPIWLGQMNCIAQFLKGTPKEVIKQLNQAQVETISEFLKTEGARFLEMFTCADESQTSNEGDNNAQR